MFDKKIFPRDEQKWKVCVYEMKGGLRVDFYHALRTFTALVAKVSKSQGFEFADR